MLCVVYNGGFHVLSIAGYEDGFVQLWVGFVSSLAILRHGFNRFLPLFGKENMPPSKTALKVW